MAIKDEIRSFIIENFLYGVDSENLSSDDSFFERGIVDSTGVLSIISYVEERYGIQVSDVEITPDNFDSIGKIAAYVNKKLTESMSV